MQITFTVPAETTSRFVVAVDRAPSQLGSVIPWRMARPHRRRAAESLGTPRLEVTRHRGARSPVALGKVPFGTDLGEEERARLRRARHHLVVASTASPADQPEAAQVARAAARALAEAYGGMIVDPLTGNAVFHCSECPGEPESFRLADDWLGWSVEIDDDASCPPWDPGGSAACTCLTVTTRGLSRFGLPEIMLEGAACAHSLCSVSVLRTVAQRLLGAHLAWAGENPRGGARTIEDHLKIAGAGVAVLKGAELGAAFARAVTTGAALGGMAPSDEKAAREGSGGEVFDHWGRLDGRPFRVRLAPQGAERICLKVGPPDDVGGSVNDWLCRTSSGAHEHPPHLRAGAA
jgi:hypothetical protein